MRRRVMIMALLLAGCAKSDDPCERQWDLVGEADGKMGLTEARLEEHQTQCPEKVSATLWQQGYQKGLAWYCRPEHLYLAGREGSEYLDSTP
ncbi:DUF2799 domain-containing protein [Aeromonas schubertii]